MKCPKCEKELARKKIDGIELEKCPGCSGIWFDFDELEELMKKEFQESLAAKDSTQKSLDNVSGICPRCGGNGKLIPVYDRINNIHIDSCKVCYGKWLDGSEYENLKNKSLIEIIRSIF
ncbi:MAG: hypothetical protein A2X49_14380 [Lentisphaerae bacterium GWF2_52_8]|nr:MAG: hypothetical protein A2X49_14380 [Lentisphaerae bacterium GWF2_52_8]